MPRQKLIAIKEFCTHHNISSTFISALHQNELIELVLIKRTHFIEEKNLQSLEKMIRLYHDLQINIEGIQTIMQLLSELENKNSQLTLLRNQLSFYTIA